MLDFETSSSKSEVSKSNSRKITSFSKTIALQREPFLTMFYTINLSPLLIAKKGFMLIIILSNYQQCSLPLTNKKSIAYPVYKTSEDKHRLSKTVQSQTSAPAEPSEFVNQVDNCCPSHSRVVSALKGNSLIMQCCPVYEYLKHHQITDQGRISIQEVSYHWGVTFQAGPERLHFTCRSSGTMN